MNEKSRYSPEAWQRKLAYGRAYQKHLQTTKKGKHKLKIYKRRWYIKNREYILNKEAERRRKAKAPIRGKYKGAKYARRRIRTKTTG